MKQKTFNVIENHSGNIVAISHPDDPFAMNWIDDSPAINLHPSQKQWGKITAPDGIMHQVKRELTDDGFFLEHYTFRNITLWDIYVQQGDIGLSLPLGDRYDDAQTCAEQRCHVHLWCAEEATWLMALRMGGTAPHLGMVLEEGSIGNYSQHREAPVAGVETPKGINFSDYRGVFILHPSPCVLLPGEEIKLTFRWFWHRGKEDFLTTAARFIPVVKAPWYVLFPGEKICFSVACDTDNTDLAITCGQRRVAVQRFEKTPDGYRAHIADVPDKGEGEYLYRICWKGKSTLARFLVQPEASQLQQRRCEFIAERQQCLTPGARTEGAFLIYDNEANRLFYSHEHDHNAGRERVAMGLLLVQYLRHCPDRSPENYQQLCASVERYVTFIKRELVESDTGRVHNDVGYNDDIFRLYNYPWFAEFFIELYLWKGDDQNLLLALRIMEDFYHRGGDKFYAIGMPMASLYRLLLKAGFADRAQAIRTRFLQHAQRLVQNGTHYPAHEVTFEQSIVAPAAWILLQAYAISHDPLYLTHALHHVKLLELFQHSAPDYRLYANSNRHWDGFWFGKCRLYGDTFPHYWSALNADVYHLLDVLGEPGFAEKAQASYRAVLSLYSADGSASCAYLFPFSVNGIPADFADPYANDQDWGLWFFLRACSGHTPHPCFFTIDSLR
ncbi:hypothetical protein ACLEXA_05040 [Pseudescherichia vulneris]